MGVLQGLCSRCLTARQATRGRLPPGTAAGGGAGSGGRRVCCTGAPALGPC